MNKLHKLREWLTVSEAARHLADVMHEPVTEADVLRLALDGHLALSVNFPTEVSAKRGKGSAKLQEKEHRIRGVWDFPMTGEQRQEVEREYQRQYNGRRLKLNVLNGAFVEQAGTRCLLPWDPARGSALPENSVFVVRTAALAELEQRKAADSVNKPLGERERTTLLTIIAVLAEHAEIDISKPSKAGETIEALTMAKGARVSARTVEEHLKRIPDALERRGKTSS